MSSSSGVSEVQKKLVLNRKKTTIACELVRASTYFQKQYLILSQTMYGINLKNVCKKMFVIFLLYFILSEREKTSSNFYIYARK